MDKGKLAALKEEVEGLGGLDSFKSGNWVLTLVQKSFRAFYANATPEFFRTKYPGLDNDAIFRKLRKAAVRQSGLAGAGSGALMSANEMIALVTGGEGLVGLPANIAAALLTVAGELLVVTKIQLELVARIARLYGVELDPNDPEDVWIILTVAIGGEVAQEAGKFGIKVGQRLTRKAIRDYVKGETLAYLRKLAAKIGYKLLQKTIVAVAVPFVSVVAATLYNRGLTGRIADSARRHFLAVAKERASSASSPSEGMVIEAVRLD